MFQIGKTIVSEDIIEKDFLCNLGLLVLLGIMDADTTRLLGI